MIVIYDHLHKFETIFEDYFVKQVIRNMDFMK